jgi:two-component system, OmpR family, response regulator
VATALRYEGYEVREALTGRDALAAALEFEPDLVVLDWMLPDIQGIEADGCASAGSRPRSSS